MKLSTRKDINASAGDVFAALTDFAAFEKLAMRQGAEISRLDGLPRAEAGASWKIDFAYRGKMRSVNSTVGTYEVPRRLGINGKSGSFDFVLNANLVPLSRGQTRLGVEFDIRPRTFAARLLLQTLKLGKSRLQNRFAARVETVLAGMTLRRKPDGPA
jgi:hypothetical protein